MKRDRKADAIITAFYVVGTAFIMAPFVFRATLSEAGAPIMLGGFILLGGKYLHSVRYDE